MKKLILRIFVIVIADKFREIIISISRIEEETDQYKIVDIKAKHRMRGKILSQTGKKFGKLGFKGSLRTERFTGLEIKEEDIVDGFDCELSEFFDIEDFHDLVKVLQEFLGKINKVAEVFLDEGEVGGVLSSRGVEDEDSVEFFHFLEIFEFTFEKTVGNGSFRSQERSLKFRLEVIIAFLDKFLEILV